jgi:hypothetical protein
VADYTPVYVPGKTLTLTASAAISGGDLLSVSGSGQVAKTAVPGSGIAPAVVIGVAASDTPINGRVTVYARGIVHESIAQGTVTAGQLVSAPQNGATAGAQVQAIAGQDVGASPSQTSINLALSDALAVIGIALTTASNPAKVRWMEF